MFLAPKVSTVPPFLYSVSSCCFPTMDSSSQSQRLSQTWPNPKIFRQPHLAFTVGSCTNSSAIGSGHITWPHHNRPVWASLSSWTRFSFESPWMWICYIIRVKTPECFSFLYLFSDKTLIFKKITSKLNSKVTVCFSRPIWLAVVRNTISFCNVYIPVRLELFRTQTANVFVCIIFPQETWIK